MTQLAGVLPVFQTPWLNDEIDQVTLAREIDWLFACGADGIVMGMVSETLRLTTAERFALAEAACRLANGRGSVTISAGAESTRAALEFARHAQRAGASALMVIPPIATACTERELERYFGAIIEAVDIPVVVQDASGYVGRPMSIELQAGLFKRHGAQVCFKPEATPLGPRLSALRDACGGEARVFEGSGGIGLVDAHRRGVCGTMPGADLIRALVALWHALQQGNAARVNALSPLVTAMNALLHSLDAYLAVEKHLLVKQGIFVNTAVRGPVSYTPDAATIAEVDRLFALLESQLQD